MTTPPFKEKRLTINYEVPLSYLIACAVSVSGALIYAGWSAQSMFKKLDDAVEVGRVLVKKHEEVNLRVLDLTIKDRLNDARFFQVENRIDRLEKK
jgi:hypothetical protein